MKQGLRKYVEEVKFAKQRKKEQLNTRSVFTFITYPTKLNGKGKESAMESLIILVKMQDCTPKARPCVNGSSQRKYTTKVNTNSPAVPTEAVLITGMIEAKQGRDVLTTYIPNAFVQIPIQQDEQQERIVMKIKGR